MKAFLNLLLIFIIGFFSSTFLFVLSPIDYKDSIIIEDPKEKVELGLLLEGENNLVNPENIVIEHTANAEMVLSKLPISIFTADIYKGDELVKANVSSLENSIISIPDKEYTLNTDTPLKTTLDISQTKLDLSDGKYKIVLKSSIISEESKNTIEINVEYDTAFTYYAAQNAVPNETMGLTVYYTDKDVNTLVPVTRYIVKEMALNKQVIYELQKTPTDKLLNKAVDEINYCVYKDNIIYIDLASDNTYYNQSSTVGQMAYNSFIKSMFAINKYLAVNYVRFTVDNYPAENYFHGIDVKAVIADSTNPKVYLGIKTDNRVYLFDHEITDVDVNANIETVAKQIMEYYTAKLPAYAKNPLPDGVVLQNATLENQNLVLSFNNDFATAFNGNMDKRNFLIDSLIYTFTSLPNVNSISIRVNNNPIEGYIENRDITGILTAPSFINPEVTNQ